MSKSVMVDEVIWNYIVQHFQDPTSSFNREMPTWYEKEIMRFIDEKERARRRHESYTEDMKRKARIDSYIKE